MDAVDAILAWERKKAEHNKGRKMVNDWSAWPADVVKILDTFCELWTFRAPHHKKMKAFWIDSARQLEDSCGEFGVDALIAYRKEFEEYIVKHDGLAPFRVDSPKSLVNVVAGKAAELRQGSRAKPGTAEFYKEDSYAWAYEGLE